MISVLRNTPRTLQHTFAIDATATNPTPDSATVKITEADGTELVPTTPATDSGTGLFSYTLDPQADLNLLTVTWTATFASQTVVEVDQVEIVGGVYCSLSELRAMPGLDSTSVEVLAAKRREFESIAERYNGVAWVPRFARETYAGNGSSSLLLDRVRPRSILSATSTDTSGTVTTFTTTNWRQLDYGQLVTDGDVLTASTYGERNITVEYEHGHDAPPPELVQACKDYVAAKVLQSTNRRARDLLSSTDPSGFTERWSTPDWDAGRPTGLLDVDTALNSLGRAAPLVG